MDELILRHDKPPVDQFDFDDRHETRATQSEEALRRYAARERDLLRLKWNELAMDMVWLAALLIGFVILVVVYLTGVVALSRLAPLSLADAARTVGLAYVAAGGAVAAKVTGRAIKKYVNKRS